MSASHHNRAHNRVALAALLALALTARPAAAQFNIFEQLFKSVSFVQFRLNGALDGENSDRVELRKRGITGFGIEVGFTASARVDQCSAADKAAAKEAPIDWYRYRVKCGPSLSERRRELRADRAASEAALRPAGTPPQVRPATLASTGGDAGRIARACVDAAVGASDAAEGAPAPASPAGTDTVVTPKQVTVVTRRVGAGPAETTMTCALEVRVKEPPAPDPLRQDTSYVAELGLGFGQISGFRSPTSASQLDLRGSLRELPSASIYVRSGRYALFHRAFPYVGLRTGLLALQGVRAYRPTASASTHSDVYSAASGANTFRFGGLAGLAIRLSGRLGALALAEAAYTRRRFPSVEWSGGSTGVPNELPRSLNFSGWNFTVGARVPVGASRTGG